MRMTSAIKHAVARAVRSSAVLSAIKQRCDGRRRLVAFQNSRQYWEQRYEAAGDSGEGSYGKLARYKAGFINSFCQEHDCKSVIEFGCGDGNQTSLLSINTYTGIDISEKCIAACRQTLSRRGYQFFTLEEYLSKQVPGEHDLSMSLDVIYHLVENDVYQAYLATLLNASSRHALIYASNFEHYDPSLPHVRHRRFIDDIQNCYPDWELLMVYDNPFSKQHDSREYGSFAQFHLLQRKPSQS